MQIVPPSLIVKPSMKTDKNIKYSGVPFTQYQKAPDVPGRSCYRAAKRQALKDIPLNFRPYKSVLYDANEW